MSKNIKVFIGFTEVAGYYKNLHEGFLKNNIKCGYLNKGLNKLNYKTPTSNSIFFKLLMFYNKIVKNKILRILFTPAYLFITLLTFINIMLIYDVLIIHLGSSLFKGLDIPLYKFFKKKLIVVSLGS